MKKRLVSIILLITMVEFCVRSSESTDTLVPVSKEIIETTRIKPSRDIVSELGRSIHETKNWDSHCSDSTIQITQSDAQLLLKVAHAEAGTEGVEGQLLVIQTIWNRVNSDKFPNSIQEVVDQPHQFTYYKNSVPTWETHVALAMFESNIDYNSDVIGFESVSNGSTLSAYFDYCGTYGNHNFYKLKNR